jgi:hypothetical protein
MYPQCIWAPKRNRRSYNHDLVDLLANRVKSLEQKLKTKVIGDSDDHDPDHSWVGSSTSHPETKTDEELNIDELMMPTTHLVV